MRRERFARGGCFGLLMPSRRSEREGGGMMKLSCLGLVEIPWSVMSLLRSKLLDYMAVWEGGKLQY